MYDGSRNKYEDNVIVTRKVAEFCHKKGMCVQGELGSVPYIGETSMGDIDWNKYMTDPDQAADFVCKTGIDALAVAIGNAHGFFKERGLPDYERLENIHKKVAVPLILHGASDWENGKVKEVIARGICCFNVDTAIRLAFVNSLTKSISERGDMAFDVRKLLGSAREAVKNTVKEKINFFGSAGKVEINTHQECVFDNANKNLKE
jgi:ketose-bisphosphate aldolase